MGVSSFGHTIEQCLYFFLCSDLFQVVIGTVVEGGEAGRVGGIAFGDADHHALAGARQQDSVSVDLIGSSLFRADVLPAVAGEREVLPRTVIPTQIAIPNHAGPVQLQALHIELRGSIFKELRGSDIRNIIQEPVHRVRLAADIDRERAQALRLRRNDQAVD